MFTRPIEDHSLYRDPIVKRCQTNASPMLEIEGSEIKRLLDAVYFRIEKIDFNITEKLRDYLIEEFPKEKWPRPVF